MMNCKIKSVCLIIVFIIGVSVVNAKPSQCYGTTSHGKIDNAVQLPTLGSNFIIYNQLGGFLGRNYVHSLVSNIVLAAYANLSNNNPKVKYKYAETGWRNGGQFKPHKTHQNGLSVDFMVPVINEEDKSVYFDTSMKTKFGYDVEFDNMGKFQKYQIDFESLAAHLVALDRIAKKNGIELKRVIFAPELRTQLFKTSQGNYLQNNITFMKSKAWVRHDEHYHIDFDISCKKLM